MAIPLLEYAPSSQNQRVLGFEVPGDEQPRIYTTDNLLSASDMDVLIMAAYRQIFNEQQMTASSRQIALESQLKAGQITVKEFIRGLAISDVFRSRNYDTNNNYRFAQMCIQRILGREVYSDREKLAWSIVLATKGLKGFVDNLLSSEEYLNTFGDNIVPYQQRRILPQHTLGDLPFARMARYGADYRDKLPKPSFRRKQQKAESLFSEFERFDFQTFVHRANWSVVAAVLLSLSGVIFLLLMLNTALTLLG
ncbi:phycobilisome rod-core linker polypeptide CpcG [Scytonema tolypothrichoides VB-61278]|nr:phycobilisome rod-core linker polypeptide CpcG [Scytonema tolypothrichoides VB-61278]